MTSSTAASVADLQHDGPDQTSAHDDDDRTALVRPGELRRCAIGPLLVRWYRLPGQHSIVTKLIRHLEGGHFYSASIREILTRYHNVTVGSYSYGPCCVPRAFPAGVTVGRYVSVAVGVRVLTRNHPLDCLSMHPFFFNRQLGYVQQDGVEATRTWIGHDAWMGENAILTPRCRRVGIGAVVGAGSVVTRDVPDFAIVAGNPARLLRYRFDEATRELVLASRWWELSIEQLRPYITSMTQSLGVCPTHHPLIRNTA